MSVPTAATPAELLASLRRDLPTALPTTMTATGLTPTAGNDLYEAYLFGLVMRAARREGFSITLADAAGAATAIRLRRAPGRLPSGGSPGARFTHAVLACPLRPALELHTGVRVVGRSKVLHEADVLLLPQAEADRCRGLNLDPRGSDAVLLIEAKYYTDPVGLDTGREFLGLSTEVSAKNKVFVATLAGESVTSLFAGRTPVVAHDIGVLPRRPAEDSLLSFIQRALRNYRSRR
jgi:hypothetical protein